LLKLDFKKPSTIDMQKLGLFIFITFTLFSCESKKEKGEITQLERKLNKLESEYNSKKDLVYSLCLDENEELEFQIEKNSSDRDKRLSFLLKDDSWFVVNKENLLKMFIEDVQLKEYDVERGLAMSYMFYPLDIEYRNPLENHYNFTQYLVSKIDRSPESLATFFTPEVKETGYTLLRHNNLYRDSGVYAMVKSLVLAYEGFEYKKEPLSRIYSIASGEGEGDYEDIRSIVSSLATNASEYSTVKSRLTTIYTFWARRYHEGNLEFTYSLLKEIHRNVAYEEI